MSLVIYSYEGIFDFELLHSELQAAFTTNYDHLTGSETNVDVYVDSSITKAQVDVVIANHIPYGIYVRDSVLAFRAYANNNTIKLWSTALEALYEAIGDDDSASEDNAATRYDNVKAIMDNANQDLQDKFSATLDSEEGVNLLGIIPLSTKRAYVRCMRRFVAFYIPALLSLKTSFLAE